MELSANTSQKNILDQALQQNNKLLAIKILYELYADKIYGLMVKKLADVTQAQEIVEKTFMQAYGQLEIATGNEFSFSWLMSLARKICKPDKNHLHGNTVTEEEKIMEMIICNGATIKSVATLLQKTEDEIKIALKSSLMKYKRS